MIEVQARLLSDARQGRLRHPVLGQLLLYAYGRPATSSGPEATMPVSELAGARPRPRLASALASAHARLTGIL